MPRNQDVLLVSEWALNDARLQEELTRAIDVPGTPCPVCMERRKAKAAAMRRWRGKVGKRYKSKA